MANSLNYQPDKPEHPSTYVVQDRSSEEELIRLDEQDHLITSLLGGTVPEQEDPGSFQHVLDVGCGPGGWLIDMARAYPTISALAGVDISGSMIAFAREQAKAAQVSDRVEFRTGDALRMLEFPSGFFDLVNQRLGMSFLRTWDWPKLLHEYQRVCRSEGIIRITENALVPDTNSPALRKLTELLMQALYQAGHFFTLESEGVTRHLAELMQKHGIMDVQTKVYTLDYNSDPELKQLYIQGLYRLYRTTVPFIRKWVKFSFDYQDAYQQMVDETQQPEFTASNRLTTVWGKVL